MLPAGVISFTVADNSHKGMGVGQPRCELIWDDQDCVSHWLTAQPLSASGASWSQFDSATLISHKCHPYPQ